MLTAIVPIDKNSAILAGSSDFGPAKIPIDPASLTEDDRLEIVACNPKDDGSFDISSPLRRMEYQGGHPLFKGVVGDRPIFKMPRLATANEDTVRELLADRRKQWMMHCKNFTLEIDKLAEKVDVYLGTPLEKLVEPTNSIRGVPLTRDRVPDELLPDFDRVKKLERQLKEEAVPYESIMLREFRAVSPPFLGTFTVPAVNEHHKAADKLAREITFSPEAIREAIEEREKLLKKRLAEQRREEETVREWIDQHATTEQRERYQDGLLPEEEIKDGMRCVLYAPLDRFERFHRLKDSEVCRCEWSGDVDYDVKEAESASKREYATFKAIRDVARTIQPDAKATLLEHKGYCDSCESGKRRKSVRVELTYGPFVFRREYACPQPESDKAGGE